MSLDNEWKKFVAGINRYIMECKFRARLNPWRKMAELIDTLWNVNV